MTNGAVIEGTAIAVDVWSPKKYPWVRYFFLSHMHSDHTQGLTPSWRNMIYCSEVSKRLLIHQIGINANLVESMEIEVPKMFKDENGSFTVTLLDANHCPGAVMFLFEGEFGRVLYTGDFRCDSDFLQHFKSLNIGDIDKLYFDNTYFQKDKGYFPSRLMATMHIMCRIEDHLPHGYNIVIICYNLGKEQLLVEIARKFNQWIIVSEERLKTLAILNLPNVFTTNDKDGRIRVIVAGDLKKREIREWIMSAPTIAIFPTGRFDSENIVYENYIWEESFCVNYSDHSSYSELVRFIGYLQPEKVIPITKNATCSYQELIRIKSTEMGNEADSISGAMLSDSGECILEGYTPFVFNDDSALGAKEKIKRPKKDRKGKPFNRNKLPQVKRTISNTGVVFESSDSSIIMEDIELVYAGNDDNPILNITNSVSNSDLNAESGKNHIDAFVEEDNVDSIVGKLAKEDDENCVDFANSNAVVTQATELSDENGLAQTALERSFEEKSQKLELANSYEHDVGLIVTSSCLLASDTEVQNVIYSEDVELGFKGNAEECDKSSINVVPSSESDTRPDKKGNYTSSDTLGSNVGENSREADDNCLDLTNSNEVATQDTRTSEEIGLKQTAHDKIFDSVEIKKQKVELVDSYKNDEDCTVTSSCLLENETTNETDRSDGLILGFKGNSENCDENITNMVSSSGSYAETDNECIDSFVEEDTIGGMAGNNAKEADENCNDSTANNAVSSQVNGITSEMGLNSTENEGNVNSFESESQKSKLVESCERGNAIDLNVERSNEFEINLQQNKDACFDSGIVISESVDSATFAQGQDTDSSKNGENSDLISIPCSLSTVEKVVNVNKPANNLDIACKNLCETEIVKMDLNMEKIQDDKTYAGNAMAKCYNSFAIVDSVNSNFELQSDADGDLEEKGEEEMKDHLDAIYDCNAIFESNIFFSEDSEDEVEVDVPKIDHQSEEWFKLDEKLEILSHFRNSLKNSSKTT